MGVKTNRRNREVVNVENRLYSPAYDFEGDDGLAWHELGDSDAMCFWGICSPASYNGWAKSTGAYIENILVPHYKTVLSRAQGQYQGGALPQDMQDLFNKVHDFILSWDEAGIKPDKTYWDNYSHPLNIQWQGMIRNIVTFFDDAAAQVDILDDIAAGPLNSKALVKGVPQRTLEPAPGGGGYFKGPPSDGGGNGGSTMGKALGIMAIGAAGYFGFKVLTE